MKLTWNCVYWHKAELNRMTINNVVGTAFPIIIYLQIKYVLIDIYFKLVYSFITNITVKYFLKT